MSEADRLPPVLQRRMARLALKGWTFRAEASVYYSEATTPWHAQGSTVTGRLITVTAYDLQELINKLVGYDA